MVVVTEADAILARVTEIRATRPEAIAEALARRRRRRLSPDGTLFLVAADHPARGVLKAGHDPMAMADRGELLHRLVVALGRPGVDGLLATADVVDDLALLGCLDDRVTGYSPEGIAAAGLDGGKMMLRIADHPATLATLEACARAIDGLASHRLPALIEGFASQVEGEHVRDRTDPDSLIRAITVASGLGTTSARVWLKLPVVDEMERVMRATSLPTLLLGGDTGGQAGAVFERWEQAMTIPQVRRLVAGRALLYPSYGDVAAAVDAAASIVSRKARVL